MDERSRNIPSRRSATRKKAHRLAVLHGHVEPKTHDDPTRADLQYDEHIEGTEADGHRREEVTGHDRGRMTPHERRPFVCSSTKFPRDTHRFGRFSARAALGRHTSPGVELESRITTTSDS
jgi:hypothetical protein